MSTADHATTVQDGPAPRTGPRTSIATVCLSGTLEDKLTASAAAGFEGVEIFENDLVATPWSPARVRQRCAELGLSVDLYQPFRDFEAVPPDVLEANLRRAERKFDVMAELGAETVLVCSSVSADAVDDDDLAAEQLHLLASRAAERGLRVAYEALAWGRFVNTFDHSWRIVRRADHPALGLCLDSFHVLSRGSDPTGIRVIPGAKMFFLQLADAPRMDMDVLQWSRHYRLFPGQGAFDLAYFTAQVLATGYDGPLSLEVFNDVFRQADPRATGVDAMRSLLALQEAVASAPAKTRDTELPPAPAKTRDAVRVTELPPAPELTGHAFTELGVDDISGPDLGNALTALGFVHSGQHRSKPVQLWEQGEARVLLNSSDDAGVPPGGAAVTALAVDSADPAVSARRAEKLLAPLLPRDHRGDEADLSAVAAPDGTAVFFCRSDAPPEAIPWLSDFAPTDNKPGEGLGLTRTDHVSLTQPFDRFDQAALFYRSVLGLRPEPTTEFTAPFGLIRSRAVADPASHVRIALNVAALRRGDWGRGDWAPAVPEPQHVAFSTADIIAAARAVRSKGAPVLDIPGNYYDDLDARLAPNPDFLAVLREHSVLYDRDEHGEFLHFYTEMLGSRVFFEVVQRIGGYGGFGTVNSPVRMAAHRRLRLERDHQSSPG